MDVINFSGGGPQTDPQSDALVEAVRNVSAAGVVPVISAGNDRDEYGLGSAGSPGTAPDAISVAALSNSHVYAPALRLVGADAPAALTRVPFVGAGGTRAPVAWGNSDQALVDVGTVVGVDGTPVSRKLCGPPANTEGGRSPLPAGSLQGAIALVSRGDCTFALKAARVKAAGGDRNRVRRQPLRRGERDPRRARGAGRDGLRPRRRAAPLVPGRQGRPSPDPRRTPARGALHGPQRRRHELLLGRPDRLRAPAQARRRSARRPDPLRDARDRRRAVRRVRRHEHGGAARRGRGGPPPPAPPGLVAATGQVGTRLDRRSGLGRHLENRRGARADRGKRPHGRRRREQPAALHRSGLALLRRPERQRRRRLVLAAARALRRRRRRGHLERRGARAGSARRRPHRSARNGRDPTRRRRPRAGDRARVGHGHDGRGLRLPPAPPRRRRAQGSVRAPRHSARARLGARSSSCSSSRPATRDAASRTRRRTAIRPRPSARQRATPARR